MNVPRAIAARVRWFLGFPSAFDGSDHVGRAPSGVAGARGALWGDRSASTASGVPPAWGQTPIASASPAAPLVHATAWPDDHAGARPARGGAKARGAARAQAPARATSKRGAAKAAAASPPIEARPSAADDPRVEAPAYEAPAYAGSTFAHVVAADSQAETPYAAERVAAPLAMQDRRTVRILLVEDVPQVVDRIRELLRSTQGRYKLVAVATDGRRAEEDVLEHRPDIVVVDTLLQGRVKGPAVIERLRRTRNPLPCVAITLPDRPLAKAIVESVDAVVTLPFGTFDLVRALRAALDAGARRNPTLATRVIAVFSAKGGVGKTTIALNLAVAMRAMGLRTALVDGSLQFGDLRHLLGASVEIPSIIDLPTDAVRSSDLVDLMVPGPGGVEVLFAPPRLEQAELVSTHDLDKMLEMLRRTYHAVVIDTPSSLNETTLALLDAADVIVQVVTPESAALDITRVAAEAFAGIGYPEAKLRLLLNRANTQGTVSPTQVGQVFGRDPDFVLSSDWALVAASNARGTSFVAECPEAGVSLDVRRAAAQLAAVVGLSPADMVVRQRRGYAA